MNILEAIILGLTQGLTEFIPVSSSGHLVLLHEAFGITENGLMFDVSLHIGTFFALILYFHKDIVLLVRGLFGKGEYSRLVWLLALATGPAVVVGILLESAAESAFRSARLVGINLIIFGGIMLFAEKFARRYENKTKLKKISFAQALTVGAAQAAAIVPGVSRSGSTITTGLFLGLDRVAATRFSFLLGIPVTAGAIAKVLLNESAISQINDEAAIFATGVLTALFSGLFAIRFLLRFLAKHSLATFAYYRIVLGLLALVVATL